MSVCHSREVYILQRVERADAGWNSPVIRQAYNLMVQSNARYTSRQFGFAPSAAADTAASGRCRPRATVRKASITERTASRILRSFTDSSNGAAPGEPIACRWLSRCRNRLLSWRYG